MSSSELVDIHVLEETASRVSALTKSITKQISVIEEVTQNANRALGPASKQHRNWGQFRENAASVLNVYDKIEQAARLIHGIEEKVAQGPGKLGWQEYINVVSKAQSLSSELSLCVELQKFPQLPNAAKQQFQNGVERLLKHIKRIAKLVFVPIDGKAHLGSSEPPPQFAAENIASLAELIESIGSISEIPRDTIDQAVLAASENYMNESLNDALKEARKIPGNAGAQAYRSLCGEVNTLLINGYQQLYGSDRDRFDKMRNGAEQIIKCHLDSANFRGSNESSSALRGPLSPMGTETKADGPGASAPNLGPQTQPSNARQASIEALQGPHISQTAPSGRSSVGTTGSLHTPALKPLNTNLSAANPAEGNAGSVPLGNGPPLSSPATMSSAGLNSSTSATSNTSSGWAAFEYLDRARQENFGEEEVAKYKRDGMTTLMQVFVDIEQQCRTSPITSEFGVSGASLQFMKTLQNVHSAGHGLEVVLSEMATRAYLTKPPPMWAKKSEPTPAARANPVSLYFSDTILCLHASLHQVSEEQLKDITKVGIFMLSNLTAIEQYIINSKTDTLATVAQNTALMDHMGDIALQKLQQLIEQSFREYLTDWSKLAPHLMESTITGANTGNAKLTSKERDTVKEKFRLFNTEFEALVERQKKYQVSDPVLRKRMSQEVKKLIGPLYLRFYVKHKDGDFTKNLAKYVKYTPQQFDEAISF